MTLLICSKCKGEVEKTAKICPHCGYKPQKTKPISTKGWIVLIIFSLIILGGLVRKFDNKSKKMDKTQIESSSDDRYAYNLSKDFVLKNLKSPQTAEFPSLFESKNHVKTLGSGRYKINSWVDSENSYGAKIRIEYSCIMINHGKYDWSIESLQLSQ